MCACEPGYTCTCCRDTPDDPRYHNDPDPREADAARAAFAEGASEHDPD